MRLIYGQDQSISLSSRNNRLVTNVVISSMWGCESEERVIDICFQCGKSLLTLNQNLIEPKKRWLSHFHCHFHIVFENNVSPRLGNS